MSQEAYFSVRIGSFPPNTPIPFDLYVRIGSKIIPYLKAGDALDAMRLTQLATKDTGHFFILESERWNFRHFMKDLIFSEALETQQKSLILKESALSFIEEIYEKPTINEALQESKTLIVDFVSLLDTNPEVLAGALALSSHDFYTFNHSLDVSIYALGLGRALGWDHSMIEELGVGALFHDIGKRLVPAVILCKRGGLSDEEWEIMKQHPQFGLDILLEQPSATEGVIAACFEHHESWMGTGYPRKLQGEEIHPFGRLLAIVDTFDAMTTQRSYNKPLSPEEALRTMSQELKGRYDPEMLKAMTEVLFLIS
jgi:HD-GYP domain-containing protein (c-di-GMP phosphodiesterase class II)